MFLLQIPQFNSTNLAIHLECGDVVVVIWFSFLDVEWLTWGRSENTTMSYHRNIVSGTLEQLTRTAIIINLLVIINNSGYLVIFSLAPLVCFLRSDFLIDVPSTFFSAVVCNSVFFYKVMKTASQGSYLMLVNIYWFVPYYLVVDISERAIPRRV